MTTAPTVFWDTETTGLRTEGPDYDWVWEFAAIRREPDGTETEWHTFLLHDRSKALRLPEPFLSDYTARYDADKARDPFEFRNWTEPLFSRSDDNTRPHVVGAVPDFDARHLRRLLGTDGYNDPWHHHITCVEVLAVGYLNAVAEFATDASLGVFFPGWTRDQLRELAEPEWVADDLYRALGIDPGAYARHQAMGDTRLAVDVYDRVRSVK